MSEAETVTASGRDLKPLFEPKSVAVIGASRRKEAVGYAILTNLVSSQFKGKIYPVNPNADELQGLRCYPSVQSIPEPVDLAVIVVGSNMVVEALKQCGEKKVKGAIVITAGFREIGGDGINREKEVIEVANRYGIPVLGPNCLGLINTDPKVAVNASFSRTMPRPGKIAFISQSGALCAAILDYAKGEDIGFSKFVSLGNKTSLSEIDILRYLKDDPETGVILMYLEDLVDGRAFIDAAREITGEMNPPKPILAIKSGRTPQGAKAAVSHTGSLMGSDEVYDAIFSQAGVLRVDSVSEMFDLALPFANQGLYRGNRVAIITNAGGPGIMATDACVRNGVEMAQLSPATIEALKKVLPPTANFSNPVDVIGDAQQDRYEAAIRYVIDDPNVDSLVIILTPQAMTAIEETAKVIVKVDQDKKKLIFTCFMGSADVAAGVEILEENDIVHYRFPEEAARALGAMMRYRRWLERPRTAYKTFPVKPGEVRQIFDDARKHDQKVLTVFQSFRVLDAYGFPLIPHALAQSEEEAAVKARGIGYPVAMKIVSKDVTHKFDVGGVQLNLKSDEEVRQAYLTMHKKMAANFGTGAIEGVLIQKMAQGGREVILGMNRDPHFGPILMFGLGGIYVETLKDVTFRLAPIRQLSAQDMVRSIRAYAILKGVRGQKPADFNTMVECLQRLSQLATEHKEIKEIDINPLMVFAEGQGAGAVDARIVLV